MQLRLYLPGSGPVGDFDEKTVTVRTEQDIRSAGFAAARAVREWLRQMPFVPSDSDLRFGISAEVVPDEVKAAKVPGFDAAPLPKRKRKAKK